MNRLYLYICFIIIGGISNNVQGQIFIKGDATGTGDGTSWENAFTNINDAIASSLPNDEFWIASGKYNPLADSSFYFPHDLVLLGGFEGNETNSDERNPNINTTILSGDIMDDDSPGNFDLNKSDNVLHVIFLDTFITNATVLDGLIIEFGNTLDQSGSDNDRRGGGILSFGSPIISNCTFRENFGWFGAAIYPRFGHASGIKIKSCNFVNNSAGAGGAIYINSLSDGLVENCYFSNNRSVNNGSAIYNQNSQDTIRNCIFVDNNTTGRGGIFNTGSGLVEILDCTFENNKAEDRTGAGIHNAEGIIHVSGCTFEGNSSRWGGAFVSYGDNTFVNIDHCSFNNNNGVSVGGAMSIGFQASVSIDNCEFSNNISNGGGAIFMQNDFSNLDITNSTIQANIANGSGGGIYSGAGVTVNIDKCLLYDNDGTFGGALSLSEDSLDVLQVTISNSEFTLNTASTQGGALNFNDADATVSNCLMVFNDAIGVGTGGAISNNGSTEKGSELTIVNSTIALNTGVLVNGIAQWTADSANCVLNLQNTILANDGNYTIEAGSPTINSLGGNLSNDASLETGLIHAKDLNNSDPLFVDPFFLDFHLQAASPCIDAGVSDGAPTLDLEGKARVGEVDMGAFEYTGGVGIHHFSDINVRADAFPSIFNDQLKLYLDGEFTGKFIYSFVNVKGQQFKKGQLIKSTKNQNWVLDTDDLPTGSYWIKVELENQFWTKPLILVR